MVSSAVLRLLAACCIAGCAQLVPEHQESQFQATRMKEAGDRYTRCLYKNAERNMSNPAAAEAIAVAAHSSCWSEWTTYSQATYASYGLLAQTPEEMQLAHDKAHAHLRQFELEAREAVMSRVIGHGLRLEPTRDSK